MIERARKRVRPPRSPRLRPHQEYHPKPVPDCVACKISIAQSRRLARNAIFDLLDDVEEKA